MDPVVPASGDEEPRYARDAAGGGALVRSLAPHLDSPSGGTTEEAAI